MHLTLASAVATQYLRLAHKPLGLASLVTWGEGHDPRDGAVNRSAVIPRITHSGKSSLFQAQLKKKPHHKMRVKQT